MQAAWRKVIALIAVIAVAGGAQAQKPIDVRGMEPECGQSRMSLPAATPASTHKRTTFDTKVSKDIRMIAPSALKATKTTSISGLKKSALLPKATTGYTGSWIMTYQTLLQGGSDGGGGVTMEASTSENVYVIKNFWSAGLELAVTINPETRAVTIPNQVIAKLEDGTEVDVTAINQQSGDPLRNTPITGRVNADGTISIDTWWAIYRADKNTMKDGMIAAYYNTSMIRPNGQMSFTQANETYTVPVYAYQPADNVLEITNIIDGGLTIELTLNRDLTATIALQPIFSNTTATYNIANANILGENVEFTTPVTTLVATDKKVLKWVNWSGYGITSEGKGTWLGMFDDAVVTLDNEITYPSVNVSSLKGEGTAANPWLITSKDDMIYLADKINNTKLSNSVDTICTGEYFRVENDIDMGAHRFAGIANDYYHIFNGTFDGNGHTISNLTMNTQGDRNIYGGLFGRAGDKSLITNLVVKGANITANAFCGGVVAWSTGTVSNVTVKSSTLLNTSNGVGPIGNVINNITNCHADSCNVTGLGGYASGLIGQLNGNMKDCSATNMRIVCASRTTGPDPSGGLVGLANYKSVISDSYFSGIVDGNSQRSASVVGGLVGTVQGATIKRCFAVGTISGYSADAYTGGLVGEALSINMTDCYFTGRVDGSSSKKSGGLMGYTGFGTLTVDGVITKLPTVIKNCYSAAALTADTYLYNAQTERRELLGVIAADTELNIENAYYNKQLVDFGSKEYGVMTSDLVAASGPAGFPASQWEFTEGQYPRLKGIDENQAALYSASALIMKEGSNLNKLSQDAVFDAMGNTDFGYLKEGKIVKEGYFSKIDGNKLILNDKYEFGTDTLYIVNGRAQYHYFIKVAPVPFKGDGTAESPYLISTKDDLIKLSEITTTYGQSFPDTYFKMTNDIDLEYSEEFLGIMCDDNISGKFNGTFDGNGYAVHRMKINQVQWTKEPTDTSLGTLNTSFAKSYKGFFGKLGEQGVVRNVTIADDCSIVLGAYSGAVVAYNFGLVENCRNYADVTTYSGIYVAGIVGYNNNTAYAIVSNCYNAGNITGGRYGLGGITGVNYALVKECVNTGNVTATVLSDNYDATKNYLTGGITGSMSGRLENCVNYGTVTGNERIGGISGSLDKPSGSFAYFNDVVNCINLGMVYSNDWAKAGAFGGVSGTNGEVKGNYWDSQMLPIAAAANAGIEGINGATTATLTSGTPLEGYDTEIWNFAPGVYPALKARVAEKDVIAARFLYMSIPDNKNAYNLTGLKSALSISDGITWKLAKADAFSIENNTLIAPVSVEDLVVDTIYAHSGKLIKPIMIKALPAIPLKGAGTESDPYQINNAADWNALALFMTQTSNGLDGEFVALMDDIDFDGTDFVPLANDGVTFLNGTLDGKGHTAKSIKFTPTATFAGAIGVVGTTGVVKNLTLSGAVTSTLASTGGFTGKLYGKLDNCVNAISISSNKATVGGFAATMYDNATVTNCVNKADLSGVSSVGGIAGTFDTTSHVTLIKCGNEGQIKGNATSAYVGGIVGTAMPATFTECYNNGIVTMTTPTSQSFAAGIIGYASGVKDAAPYEITGCSNTGAITAKSGAAGIVANVHGTATYTTLHITGCTNSGKITAKGTSNTSNTSNAGIAAMLTPGSVVRECTNSGDVEVGVNTNTAGIAAYARVAATAAAPIKVVKCTNTGNISGKNYYVGGIFANVAAYTYVDSCYNSGDVAAVGAATVSYGVAGIAAVLTNVNASVTNSSNIGNISGTNRVGGIVGMNAQKAIISDCWNGGEISSTSTVQGTTTSSGYGIGGVAGQGSSIMTRCYNYGTVKGASRVGGVVGATTKNNTSLIDCYNAGRIEAPADSCGNLVGVKVVGNGSVWNTSNSIENSYYVTDFGVFDNTGDLGTGVTMAQLAKTDLGEGWTIPGEYSLPIAKVFEKDDAAMLYSAAVIVAPNDTYDNVTTNFNVGTPGGVQWTASVDAIAFDGNTAKFTAPNSGDVTLTASLGELKRTFTIKTNAVASGINDMEADQNADAEYYSIQGIRVANPEQGEIYIVRRGANVTKEIYR